MADEPRAPAGWYADGQGGLRYWDGKQWTSFEAPAQATPAVQPAKKGGSTALVVLLVVLGICFLGVILFGWPIDSGSNTAVSDLESTAGSDLEYTSDCGYLTGDDRSFTADAMVENPGPKEVTVELKGEWRLAGGGSINDSKRQTVPAGKSRRIGIQHPATLHQILAHQDYEVGEPCTAEVSIIKDRGEDKP